MISTGTLFKPGRLMGCLIIILVLSINEISGQKVRQETPPLRERLFFGGSFGLQFGTFTNIQVSPVVGIWLLPRVAVAAGPNFMFYKDPFGKTNIYGGKGYAQFVLVRDLNSIIPIGVHTGIFLHLEDELLNLESEFWQTAPVASERFTINTVLAGGGISQQLGRRSSMNFTVLWALSNSIYDIYGNPEIRISFNF